MRPRAADAEEKSVEIVLAYPSISTSLKSMILVNIQESERKVQTVNPTLLSNVELSSKSE